MYVCMYVYIYMKLFIKNFIKKNLCIHETLIQVTQLDFSTCEST
jgi:hypothetical protein